MASIAQVLPLLLAWIACYCLARELAARRRVDNDWRIAFALASAGWGSLVTVITELLSLAQSLTLPAIWTAWALVDVGLFASAVALARKRGVLVQDELRAWWKGIRAADFSEWPWEARCYLVVTVAVLAFFFSIALTFATTNWDSLTYHLPRIMHWAQNESVAHFATNNTRQVEFAPWSSFVSLMLYLLWGNDRLINLVQWSAMAGTVVLISFMVKRLTFHCDSLNAAQRHRMTGLACVFAVTVPMGLMQCVNPQTDYTAAFWVCCLVCFALALFREPGNGWYMLGAGLACGLGTLTKATVYVYAAPLVIGFGIWWILRAATGVRTRLALIFCAAFFVLNAGHMMRNFVLFGSPLGSPYVLKIERNQRITASGTAANIIRNISLHSRTGIAPLTTALNSSLASAHAWTGRDHKDPEITYHNPGVFRFYNERLGLFDSFAPAPYHLGLVLLALALAACKAKHYRTAVWHAAWIVASFILFCAYLKWQFWHTRLHLAYLLLFSPVVAWVLIERLPRWSNCMIVTVLVWFGGYSLSLNRSCPFWQPQFATLPREQQPLAVSRGYQPMNQQIENMAELITQSGCHNVGLKLAFNEAEYVIWQMLRNRGFKGVIHHTFVQNESGKIRSRYPEPDMLIFSRELGTPEPTIQQRYPICIQFGTLLLVSKELPAQLTQR